MEATYPNRVSSYFTEVLKKHERLRDQIQVLEEDYPPDRIENYLLYRMTGIISYMNFYSHEMEVGRLIAKRADAQAADQFYLVFSFRYVHNIDRYAMNDFAQLVESVRMRTKVSVLITGLHTNLVEIFCENAFFMGLIEEQQFVFKMAGRDLEMSVLSD